MANLSTIETRYGLQSNQGLGCSKVFLRRGPETRFEVPVHAPSAADVIDTNTLKRADTALPEPNILPAQSLLTARRILVPFDFSTASVRLLRWAISTAEASGATISVLHVVHPWVPPVGRQEPFHFEPNTDRVETARSLLRRLLKQFCQSADAVTVHVVVGQPVDEIVRFGRASKADLILMVPHGQRGLKHPILSATTERATRRASCLVLVVPESVLQRWDAKPDASLTDFRRILVPTDFSPGSAAALRFAVDIAQERLSEVYVLNFSTHGFLRPVAGLDEANNAKRVATERLAQWISTHLGSTDRAIPQACIGKPSVYVLLREAALLPADLIVFGPRGYSWAERLRLSSSTDAILRNAPCPVLSLRAETQNPRQ